MARPGTSTPVSAEMALVDGSQTNMADTPSQHVEVQALSQETKHPTLESVSQGSQKDHQRQPQHQPQQQQAQQEQQQLQNISIVTDWDLSEAVIMERFKQRHRQQAAQFNDWFTKRAESLTKDDQKKIEERVGNGAPITRSAILAGQGGKSIIHDPREYQLELFERAKTQNTIAVLDTGSGKTLIAVLLLRWVLDQELEDRAMGKAPRIAVFLVDSVTLLFQQYAVLESNLDQKIAPFCGDMGCDLWSQQTWEEKCRDKKVVVCTADVLHQCLLHSFITLEQINILIFDEAHHAKKNHVYARIMNDFYFEQEVGKRPRIFGMTASPVDGKDRVLEAARNLELQLDSLIATTTDMNLLRHSVHRPEEEAVYYARYQPNTFTTLNVRLQLFGLVPPLFDLHRHARHAHQQLGPWCADQVWAFLVKDGDAEKHVARMEREIESKMGGFRSESWVETTIARMHEGLELLKKHRFEEPEINATHMSPKVLQLYARLESAFGKDPNEKGIVFVRERYTARVLHDLFRRGHIPALRAGILLGSRKTEQADFGVTYKQQMRTMMEFRQGLINCLFATSVAEEGLDIPDCGLIVRFDMYSTMIQYVQSRGRARRENSKYVHMMEERNWDQEKVFHDVHLAEGLLRNYCTCLSKDRQLLGTESDFQDLLIDDNEQVYSDPTTGAKLTFNSSLAVLAHYVSTLPDDGEGSGKPNYIILPNGKQFQCEVILPSNSVLRQATGQLASSKARAKRSAAFTACLRLKEMNQLDQNLLPTHQKHLPKMRNAQLALTAKNTKPYDMRTKPRLWQETVGRPPVGLYATVIHLQQPDPTKPYQPLAILTRFPLPSFPAFGIYLGVKRKTNVVCRPTMGGVAVTDARMKAINDFTLRIFKDLFNKTYEEDLSRMPYWLVPVKSTTRISKAEVAEDVVDWAAIYEVQDNEFLAWNENTPDDFFANRFMVDPLDGGRRYFTVAVNREMKPLDPVPTGTPARRGQRDSILQYTSSLYKSSRAKSMYTAEQPVITADLVLHRRNWLDEVTEQEMKAVTKCYICPEPLYISALPTGIAVMALMFPAIMYRLESYLIAQECVRDLRLDIPLDLALEALTKDSDNREDVRADQIHVERGMGKNYERLELLGDCFLKMATTIALFTRHARADEYEYHVDRMLMVCNQNLFRTAVNLKLNESIRSRGFSRRLWYPEEPKLLQGKGAKNASKIEIKHQLSEKSLADVGEALIGAALLSHHKSKNFDEAVKAVTIMVDNENHRMTKWSDYQALYEKPTYQTSAATQSQIDLARQVAEEHPYQFKWPRLVRSAFTHPSYPFAWEKIPCYQRLEFLGDALLDMACVNYLFYRYPERDPQWLTEHKMAMVSNKFLGALCVRIGFHKHIRHNGGLVENQIRNFVAEIELAREAANDAPDYWVHVKSAPKALPDIVEAYVGALFIDSDYNYAEVERFFDINMKPYFEDMSIYDTYANNHPTTLLANLLSIRFKCHNFRILAQELQPVTVGGTYQVLAAVMIHNEIVGEGRAASAKNAKTKASYEALKMLEGRSGKSRGEGEHEDEEGSKILEGDDEDLDFNLLLQKENKKNEEKQQQQKQDDKGKGKVQSIPAEKKGGGIMSIEDFQSRFSCDCGIQGGDFLEAALRKGGVDVVESEWVTSGEDTTLNSVREEEGINQEETTSKAIVTTYGHGGATTDIDSWEKLCEERKFYDEVDELEELRQVFVDAEE